MRVYSQQINKATNIQPDITDNLKITITMVTI